MLRRGETFETSVHHQQAGVDGSVEGEGRSLDHWKVMSERVGSLPLKYE